MTITVYDPRRHRSVVAANGEVSYKYWSLNKLIVDMADAGIVRLTKADTAPGDTSHIWLDIDANELTPGVPKVYSGGGWTELTPVLFYTHIAGGSTGYVTDAELFAYVTGQIGVTVQAWDDALDALSNLSGTGIIRQTAPDSFSVGVAVATAEIADDAVTPAKLQDTAVAAGGYGSASNVGTFTVDAQGRLTAASNTAIAIAAGAVSGLAAVATSGSATDLGTGTLPDARLPDNGVTNAKLADMATARFKGRVTGGSGDPEDITGTQATTLLDVFTSALKGLVPASGGGTTTFLRADGTFATPGGAGDVIGPASAVSGSIPTYNGTTGKLIKDSDGLAFAKGRLLAGTASAWTTLAVGTDGQVPTADSTASSGIAWKTPVSSPMAPQGRLTLTTATPVLTSNVTAAATIYYTPYLGRYAPLYDGSKYVMYDLGGELSQATSDATKSPAAAVTNSNYDLFLWLDGGTYRCTRGPAWSSDTSRGTGAGTTELEVVQGLRLNKVAITNGPAAQRGTYVGTIRTNASSVVDMRFLDVDFASNVASFGIWNAFNRVLLASNLYTSTASWTYASSAVRAFNGSANARWNFVSGLAEEFICGTLQTYHLGGGTQGSPTSSIGLNTTTGFNTNNQFVAPSLAAINNYLNGTGAFVVQPQLGFGYIALLESSSASYTYTQYGATRNSTCILNWWC